MVEALEDGLSINLPRWGLGGGMLRQRQVE